MFDERFGNFLPDDPVFRCSICDDVVDEDDLVELFDELVCLDCRSSHFVECSRCNEWVAEGDEIITDDDKALCQNCVEESEV